MKPNVTYQVEITWRTGRKVIGRTEPSLDSAETWMAALVNNPAVKKLRLLKLTTTTEVIQGSEQV